MFPTPRPLLRLLINIPRTLPSFMGPDFDVALAVGVIGTFLAQNPNVTPVPPDYVPSRRPLFAQLIKHATKIAL